ncbi:polysaccharide deacetylase family protein [Puia sp.]|jgi:peptidoglycan/xylan/chitin deacetylase (PgdA/CDA1 family)|uniref:polysaccharide deacetylase family protein n=1 Tax=Puia sp. TaxID=2045100 RepID=UPI002F40F500
MFYLVKTPWWLKKFYSRLVWDLPVKEQVLYLTFDDGPHPVVTPFVLDQLKQYGAAATFFCIGKNVQEHPQIYRRVLMEGHRVGNHTQNHLNGWKTDDGKYIADIREAARFIDSNLFRPPYGRISRFQSALLRRAPFNYSIIMWDVLSADFDYARSGERCLRNVIRHARPGSIIVFHDSEKAWDRLRVALPGVLSHFHKKGYRFERITLS